MTRLFEGTLVYAPFMNAERFLLVLHADHGAGRLSVRAEQYGRWMSNEMQFRVHPMLRELGVRPGDSGAAFLFGRMQMQYDPAFSAFLNSLTSHLITMPGFGSLPHFSLDMPGAGAIRAAGGWRDIAFRRVADMAIDLSTADFSDLHFSNVDFSAANITGTRFDRTRFDNCRFGRSQFVGAQLDGARFMKQHLADLDFSGATLEGAALDGTVLQDCRLVGTNCNKLAVDATTFTNCDCSGASFDHAAGTDLRFMHCNLTDARFDHARIDRWAFPQSILRRTSFRETLLRHASFAKTADRAAPNLIDDIDLDAADLDGADFTDADLAGKVRHARAPRFGASPQQRTRLVRAAFNLSFLGQDCSYVDATDARIRYDVDPAEGIEDFKARHALLPMMELAGFRLSDADFSYARLKAARFANATLRDANFTGAVLEGADFSRARLDGANFTSASLLSTNFTSAWLLEARFEDTTLANTNFSSAALVAVNFSRLHGSNLAGVNFSNACLAQADFNAVVVTSAGSTQTSFSGACLAGTDFLNARLTDAQLTNAQIAAEPGELTVNFEGRRPLEIEYRATLIDPSSTGRQTICPDGNSGPCSMQRLLFRPVRRVWP